MFDDLGLLIYCFVFSDPDIPAKAAINKAAEVGDLSAILKLIASNNKVCYNYWIYMGLIKIYFLKNFNYAWRGARALRELFIHDEDKKNMCIALKCDEVLGNAMSQFQDESIVQSQCLRAIGALAFGSDIVGLTPFVFMLNLIMPNWRRCDGRLGKEE